jgi:maltose O-acetyltransferase
LRGDTDVDRLVDRGLKLGRIVYINGSARLDNGFLWLISIGDHSVIGPDVRILAHDATMRRQLGYSLIARVEIGARVFIGAGSIVLPGVTIGDDVIVGAGSVVRSDIPSGVVVIGNPPVVTGSTAEFIGRHQEQVDKGPRWPVQGWTLNGGITDEDRRRMVEDLDGGVGYVK